jgi:hypothetical protein
MRTLALAAVPPARNERRENAAPFIKSVAMFRLLVTHFF